jgi:hypothetical protein
VTHLLHAGGYAGYFWAVTPRAWSSGFDVSFGSLSGLQIAPVAASNKYGVLSNLCQW